MKPLNYYQLLGISPDADAHTIKYAYRRQITRHHPDKLGLLGNDVVVQQLNLAYETLKDPAKHAKYDANLASSHLQLWANKSLKHIKNNTNNFLKILKNNGITSHLELMFRRYKSTNIIELPISLSDAYNGKDVQITIAHQQISLHVPKGVLDKQILHLQTKSGRFFVRIHIQDCHFYTQGKNVYYLININNKQALGLETITLPPPLSLTLLAPKEQNYPITICLNGKGIPHQNGAGNLYLKLSTTKDSSNP